MFATFFLTTRCYWMLQTGSLIQIYIFLNFFRNWSLRIQETQTDIIISASLTLLWKKKKPQHIISWAHWLWWCSCCTVLMGCVWGDCSGGRGHPELKRRRRSCWVEPSSLRLSDHKWGWISHQRSAALAESQECGSCWVARWAISCLRGLLKVVTWAAPQSKNKCVHAGDGGPELAGALMWPRLPSSEDAERMELIAAA